MKRTGKLVVVPHKTGPKVYIRVDNKYFNRVTYIPVDCDVIANSSHRSLGWKGVLLAILLWLLKDSASVAWHWVVLMMAGYFNS